MLGEFQDTSYAMMTDGVNIQVAIAAPASPGASNRSGRSCQVRRGSGGKPCRAVAPRPGFPGIEPADQRELLYGSPGIMAFRRQQSAGLSIDS